MGLYRILVVEDEAIVAMDIEERLSRMGYALAGHAVSGEEALCLAERWSPDLVLMDIRLKGSMGGIAAADALRRRLHLPVIFLTAYSEDETLDQAKRVEPMGYLLKPFNDIDLKCAIEIGIHRHRSEEQLRRMSRLFDTMSQVNQVIVRAENLEELLPDACRVIVERGGVDLAWVGRLDGDGSRLIPVARFGAREALPIALDADGRDSHELEGPLYDAIRSGRPQVCHDRGSERCVRAGFHDRSPSGARLESCASFPFAVNGRVWGLLNLCSRAPGFFGEGEVDLFEGLARDLSFALEKMNADVRRRVAEAALAESEARHRRIVDTAREGIWEIDGRLITTYVNPNMVAMLGCEASEIVGRPVTAFMFPEDHGSHDARMADRVKGQGGSHETRLRRRDGSEVWVRVNSTTILDEHGQFQGSFGMLTDITAQRQVEQSLRESEKSLRALFDAVSESVFVFDPDGRVLACNKTFAGRLSRRAEDLVGECIFDHLPPEVAARRRVWVDEVVRTGTSMAFEDERNGRWMYHSLSPIHDADGEVERVVCFAVDLTWQKRSEETLRASKEFLDRVLDSISDPIVVKDEEHRLILVNDALCDLAGCSKDMLLGKTESDFFPPEQVDVSWAGDHEVLETGLSSTSEEVFTDASGEIRTLLTRRSRYIDPLGNKYLVGVLHDITKRKQATDAIREQERRMRTLLENLPGVVYHCRNDRHWTMEFLSEGCRSLTGYAPEDLIENRRLSYNDLVHQDDREWTWDAWQEVVARKTTFQGEYRIVDASGREKWVWESGSPVFDDSGELLALEGFIMDITRRRWSEELLKKSEERYRSVVEDAPMMISTYLPDTTLLFVNDAACRYFGCAREELIGRRFTQWMSPIDRRRFQEMIDALTPEEPTAVFENEFRTGGGAVHFHRWTNRAIFDQAGKAVLYQGFGEDITERKRSQDDLLRLATAIEQSGEAVIITDARGVMQYVNPAFERATGHTREEAIGLTPSILKSGRQSASFYEGLWTTLLAGDAWTGRMTNRRKDGSLYEVEAVISPVHDSHGHISQYVGLHRDVSKEVELEASLRQAHKLEAVGKLAGGVAHDFNNMLSPILGYAEMLLDDLHPADDRYDQVMQIKKAAERSRDLTRQLLAFSRKQVLQMRPVVLDQVVENMEKLLRRTLREDIRLEVSPGLVPCSIMADVGQLDQILMNLAVNAQDAMPAGGDLRIEVSRMELTEGDCIRHPGAAPGRYGVLIVRDTGSGMDRETLDRIFEPFYTTKGERGTGLGLATVYGVVKQHQGHILVESEPTKGTCFRVLLPEADQPPVSLDGSKTAAKRLRGQETVLVVEDDEMVLRMTCSLLMRHGYTVLSAAGGLEALAVLARHEGALHLLLTDVVMPGMNGKELYDELARIRPGLKVLFMSGYTDDVIARRGLLEEGTHMIQKPFSVHDLPARIREVMDRP